MKFIYVLGNEFFFGYKFCFVVDFVVVLSFVIGRGLDLYWVVFLFCINWVVLVGVII